MISLIFFFFVLSRLLITCRRSLLNWEAPTNWMCTWATGRRPGCLTSTTRTTWLVERPWRQVQRLSDNKTEYIWLKDQFTHSTHTLLLQFYNGGQRNFVCGAQSVEENWKFESSVSFQKQCPGYSVSIISSLLKRELIDKDKIVFFSYTPSMMLWSLMSFFNPSLILPIFCHHSLWCGARPDSWGWKHPRHPDLPGGHGT